MTKLHDFPPVDTQGELETLCWRLYGAAWNDPTIQIVGRSGQAQGGVDILGHHNGRDIGIQCKCYNLKRLTMEVIRADIEKAENSQLAIDHLIMATTKLRDAKLIIALQTLNKQRRLEGKFTVALACWEDLAHLLHEHPQVASKFYPHHPDALHFQTFAAVGRTEQGVQAVGADVKVLHASVLQLVAETPPARGDENDRHAVRILDEVRDCLPRGDARTAERLLQMLGEPSRLSDSYSRFRWYTNHGVVCLMQGDRAGAAADWHRAALLMPDDERALGNRARAFLIEEDYARAVETIDAGVQRYPDSARLWHLKILAYQAAGLDLDDAAIPAVLRDTADVLFARARALSEQGRFADAIALHEQGLVVEGPTLDLRRLYLADALSWCNQTPIQAHHGHLTIAQRDTLRRAVALFEPLEGTLEAITAATILDELYNNLAIALRLCCDTARAAALVELAWHRNRHSPELLKQKIEALESADDLPAIKLLVAPVLATLELPLVMSLAQIASNARDESWFDELAAHPALIQHSGQIASDLEVLRLNIWQHTGRGTAALAQASRWLEVHPTDVFMRCFIARCHDAAGSREKALFHARRAAQDLPDDDTTAFLTYQVAEVLYSLEDFAAAAVCYEQLLLAPGDDRLTYRLGHCWLVTNQRAKVDRLLAQLPPTTRAKNNFAHLEANFAFATGDVPRQIATLEGLWQRAPTADVAINLANVLFRHKQTKRLRAFLSALPPLPDATPAMQLGLAKLETAVDLNQPAVDRLLDAFCQRPTDPEVGGNLLLLLLMFASTEALPLPKVVGPRSAVVLASDDEERCYLIRAPVAGEPPPWIECIDPASPIADGLIGLQVGDAVTLNEPLNTRIWKVKAIEPDWQYAAGKAHQLLAAAPVNEGPLYSFNLGDAQGNIDIDRLSALGVPRQQAHQRYFEAYQQGAMPIGFLAQLLDVDVATLLLSWPATVTPLLVCTGGQEDFAYEAAVLQGSPRPVLDLLTLCELCWRGVADLCVVLLGRPWVAQSTIDELNNRLQLPFLGRLAIATTESATAAVDAAPRLLQDVATFVEKHCEVVPVVGPDELPDGLRALKQILDAASFDTLMLVLEKRALLLSEDFKLRLLARNAEVDAASMQGLLRACRKHGEIDALALAKVLLAKLRAGHDFVSFTGEQLLALTCINPAVVSADALAIIETLRNPAINVQTGLQLAEGFLRGLQGLSPPAVIAAYAERLREALVAGKPDTSYAVCRRLHTLIEGQLQQLTGNVAAVSLRPLAAFLERSPLLREKALTLAIKRVLQEWQRA